MGKPNCHNKKSAEKVVADFINNTNIFVEFGVTIKILIEYTQYLSGEDHGKCPICEDEWEGQ